MLKYFGLILSIVILLINLFYFDFDDSFLSEDNKVALIGIIGSLCAMILILILIISEKINSKIKGCLLYTSPSPRDTERSRMPSSA